MQVYIGSIMTFGFNFAPTNWQLCNGQTIAISQNTTLFSLIGTTFGGNGTQTFLLPNLQSRMPIGQGTGPGLSTRVIGEAAGNEAVTLNVTNLPSHTHTATFAPAGGGYMASTNTANNKLIPSTTNNVLAGSPPGTDGAAIWATSTPAPTIPLGGGSVGGTVTNAMTGGNQPVGLMNPYLALNFSIAMFGIFPSRN